MSQDKIEYSRLLLKRTGIPGEVPTYTTGSTLNDMIPTDLFVGEMYLNTADDLMWVRTDNGILPIALSGMTGTTIPTLLEVLGTGNITGGFDIYVSSGTTIQYEGLNTGSTTTILGLDASGNTITTSVAGATQDLDNVLSYGNSTGAYDIVVSSGQTIQYQGLNNGSSNTILALDGSGNTITTSITDNDRYTTGGTITYINSNGTLDLFDNSGNTISITGLTDVYSTGGTYSNGTLTIDKNDGTSFNVSGLFTGYTSVVESVTTGTGLSGNSTTGNITLINTAPDQVVSISGGTNISVSGTYPNFGISTTGLTTPDLSQVLAQGNTTNGYDIIVSTGDTIQSPNGENEIFLQSSGSMGLQSIYTLGGNNITEQIKMRAASGSDAGIEIQSYDSTNVILAKSEYRPSSIKDISFDSLGSFVETRLESSGYTIDLTNTSAGYLTIDGLLPGTATDLLGIDSNNRVVPYTIPTVVDSVTAGTGLSGNSTTGNITLINTAPDQVVSLSNGTGISTSGTYPNFTITNTLPDQTVVLNNGSNILVTGTYPTFTIAATGLTDYYVTGGTYSNGTLTLDRQNGSVNVSGLFTGYTSVVNSLTTGTGLSANTTNGNITILNTAPDQTVTLSGGTGISTSGTYPNFNITNTIVNGSFGITIDGGGSAITTGVKGYITIPYNCTITGWDIFSDVSGSIVVDVWKDTYANFPPTVADTIAGSEKPTLSSAVKNQDNNLTTWTTSVSSGDIIGFNVDSASTLTRVNLIIKVLKTS